MIRNFSLVALSGLALVACKDGAQDHSTHDHGAQPPAAQAPAEATAKAYKQITPSKDYPLKTCVVSGEPLDAMGGPIAIEYEGREVQLCCDGCVDEFLADPKAALAKIDAAKK